jgi:cell division septal protein FtsQ
MFKRRTSKVSHRKQAIQLKAHVMSPRIVWFGFLKACSKTMWIVLTLAVLGGLGWGVRLGLQRWLFKNEEFRLQAIHLTPNTAVDERRLVEVGHINIDGTLFDCDLESIEKSLLALPEVSSASVKREFPGTLQVKVVARQPVAWISCYRAEDPILPRDPQSGLVVDSSGFAYHCPPGQLSAALELPVIELNPNVEGAAPLVSGQKVVHPEYDRAMALNAVACAASPDASTWIDTIRQSRSWALELTARDGMKATFGLGDHERQMQDLIAAVNHSRSSGQPIATINLIPRNHIPVFLKDGSAPRAVMIEDTEEPPKAAVPPTRRDSDLKQLLNRH